MQVTVCMLQPQEETACCCRRMCPAVQCVRSASNEVRAAARAVIGRLDSEKARVLLCSTRDSAVSSSWGCTPWAVLPKAACSKRPAQVLRMVLAKFKARLFMNRGQKEEHTESFGSVPRAALGLLLETPKSTANRGHTRKSCAGRATVQRNK